MTAVNAPPSDLQAALLVNALSAQHIAIAIIGKAGELAFANPAWVDHFAAHVSAHPLDDDVSQLSWFQRIIGAAGADASASLDRLRQVFSGSEATATADLECRRCLSTHWLRVTATRISQEDEDALLVTQADVTAEKMALAVADEAERAIRKAHQDLNATEARFRDFVESAHEGVIATDLTGRITYANTRAGSMVGRSRDPLLGQSVFDFMPADYAFQMRTHFVTLWRGESLTVECVLFDADGKAVDVLAALSPTLTKNGDLSGALLMLTDQRPQKETERALRDAQARLQDQWNKLPVATTLWESRDGSMFLLDSNEAARKTSPALAAAIARDIVDIYPTGTEVRDVMRRCLSENRVLHYVAHLPADNPLGFRQFDVRVGPQPPDRVLLHAMETTERVELEAQLRQSQKMEAVGQLAGGVAHDFNNLLTVIGAHTTFLLRELHPDDPKWIDADAIAQASGRAAALTRQLLAFSRRQILKPEVIDLNASIRDSQRLLQRLLGEDIEITVSLASDLRHIMADPGQIDQVLMNLAVNSRDAMPSGGSLLITTRQVTVAQGRGHERFVMPGDYAVVTVKDTGVGMDEATLARVFEPFFTTKPHGQGTGLGLATVYGIVKQSGGYVVAESSPGQGASFSVYLPTVELELTAGGEVRSDTPRGVETVLLVEDDGALRSVVKRVLVEYGYVVLEVDSGLAAIALATEYPGVIHLVLTDAVLPSLSGGEVIQRLQAQRPGIRALLMSGYTDDEIVRRGVSSATLPFVQKPFTAEVLACAVRQALGSSIGEQGAPTV